MKLFVDDERREPKGWHKVRTVTEAIRVLATVAVDEVSLDHDIQCFNVMATQTHTSEETFMAVAHYLKAMKDRPKIRIHTGNMGAGRQMADILGIPYDNYMYDEADYD